MKKKPFEQLVEIYSHNEAVGNERRALKKIQEDKKEAIYREKREKEYELEKRYNAKINKCDAVIDSIDKKYDKQIISKQELERKIKLSIIINHLLTDASCSYCYGSWKKEDVIGEIDSDLFTVTMYVKENYNKVNKFDLKFHVGFKYYYLSDYFRDILICVTDLFHKSFKTRKEAEDYAGKNSAKIMSPLYLKENFLFREIKGFEYDVLEDFDFRGVQRSVSGETLKVISKTEATFSIDYDRKPINVKYDGNGEFLVECGDEEFIKRFTALIEYGTICRIPKEMIRITKIL